jgi:hypothetical protein
MEGMRVQIWFVGGRRWVVESDVDGGFGASSEYVVQVSWPRGAKDFGLLEEELRQDCFNYMRDVRGELGLGLPVMEVVFFCFEHELLRVRWDWELNKFELGGSDMGDI